MHILNLVLSLSISQQIYFQKLAVQMFLFLALKVTFLMIDKPVCLSTEWEHIVAIKMFSKNSQLSILRHFFVYPVS